MLIAWMCNASFRVKAIDDGDIDKMLVLSALLQLLLVPNQDEHISLESIYSIGRCQLLVCVK